MASASRVGFSSASGSAESANRFLLSVLALRQVSLSTPGGPTTAEP
jgi:hypothetical protein